MSDESEGIGREEYLRLLVDGYSHLKAPVPEALWKEWMALYEARLEREHAEAEAREAERQARIDKAYGQEKSIETWWGMQRQYGRTEAAKRWFEKHGVEPWEITEIKESIQDDNENLRKAKRQQGLG